MHTRALLRRPGFRALVATYGMGEVVDWLTTIALAVLVYDATGSPLATALLFVASKFVPAFAAPALAARLDTLSPGRSLPALYAAQAAAFGAMAALGGSVAALVALAALAGGAALVARALVRAAVSAALPDPEELRRGNASLNVVFSAAFALGPALAGGAVAATGGQVTLAAGAAVLLWMALYTALTPLPALAAEESEQSGRSTWARLRRALVHVREEPGLARLFGLQAVLLVLFTIVPPIEVVYAREELGTSAAGFGALMASWGAGAVVGSALFPRLAGRGTLALTLGASVAMGVSYLGMGLAGSLALACALSAIGGVGNGVQWVAFVTAVQERTPPALQARAMALVESLGAALPGAGFALGGAIAALASARVAYAFAGVGILAVVLGAAVMARGLPARVPRAAPAAA